MVKMPQTRQEAPLDDKEILQIVDLVEKLVKRIILRVFRTRHICFYRSFVLVSIFRRLGLPVVLNIGMKNLNKAKGAAGHCWLSLDGASFFETESTMETYSVFLGESRNGMAFWIAQGVPGQENQYSAGENINLVQGAST